MVKLETGYLAKGDLPYERLQLAVNLVAKKFAECPFIASLPNIYPDDTILKRTLGNMPGIIFKDNTVCIATASAGFEKELEELNNAYAFSKDELLEKYAYDSKFFEKYLHIIKKFKSKYACINLLGIFSLSQMLSQNLQEHVLTDNTYRKALMKMICVKANWIIKKIKEYCPDTIPIVIFEEPLFAQLSILRHTNELITKEFITDIFSLVIRKIKSYGAITCIQCFEKCDWTIPIDSGVDIISYDAYNNPNNLSVMPDAVNKFLSRGGLISWGIIPAASENVVKSLSADYLYNRLKTTIDGVALSGVSQEMLYDSVLVSLNGNTSHLSVIFAEKLFLFLPKIAATVRINLKSPEKITQ
ncbi:MAG: hypothetical protein MJ237_07850 [bacterium]|nr:hypothetical protein [bacterium]